MTKDLADFAAVLHSEECEDRIGKCLGTLSSNRSTHEHVFNTITSRNDNHLLMVATSRPCGDRDISSDLRRELTDCLEELRSRATIAQIIRDINTKYSSTYLYSFTEERGRYLEHKHTELISKIRLLTIHGLLEGVRPEFHYLISTGPATDLRAMASLKKTDDHL